MPHHPALLRHLAASACGGMLLLATGCKTATPIGLQARADLEPVRGGPVVGTVHFRLVKGVVRVSGTVRGLAPHSEHGLLIHDQGDCTDNGSRIGGDFNPGGGGRHGRFGETGTHAGDLPPLRADAAGTATFSVDARDIGITAGPADVVGRSLVVHRDADDFTSQPSGATGPALACAVIRQR